MGKNADVKFIKRIKDLKGLTTNRIGIELIRMGVDITPQAIDKYEKRNSQGMQIRVLCGLRRLAGLSWSEFGKWLDEEFGADLGVK